MATPFLVDTTAWSATLMGFFALFAAIGALRKPGVWQTMVVEIEKSPALQMLCGFAELVAGALVYLANPWIPSDILTCVMRALGGLMIVEALVVLGFSDIYFHFWLKSLSFMHRAWALASLVAGLALAGAGLARFS